MHSNNNVERTVAALLVILAMSAACFAQTRKFAWSNETCEFQGTYDARKYSETALRDTLKLIEPGSFSIQTEATAWKYEDIKGLSLAALDTEYKQRSSELRLLKLVKAPFFEALRRRKQAEMDRVYQLSRVTIRAYTDPSALAGYDAGACSTRYAGPLISGGEPLLAAWRRVSVGSRKNNADPERLRRIFDEQYNSSDREQFARIEVMMFGWWNCANALVRNKPETDSGEREFRKVFTRVKATRCDEP
jgi:hypothetical protein